MRVEHLSGHCDVQALLRTLGVDGGGVKILASKARMHLIMLRDLHVGAANILKQDALSVGADLAVPKGTVVAATPTVDALLMATSRQLAELARKELAQPFGLKAVAQQLKPYAVQKRKTPVQIMGVLNINDDSFFEGSRFKGAAAEQRIAQMAAEGADVIDIGGVSSRPGSVPVSPEQELERVQPIIDAVYVGKWYDKVRFSIDSHAPSVIAYALEHGFNIVNDITGLTDAAVVKLCGAYGATAIIMHMQGTPQTMQDSPQYDALFEAIDTFFASRLEMAQKYGVDDTILDVGIGFGKTLEHNLRLIRDLAHFSRFDTPLLIGASRKSMIDKITPSAPSERLPGTLALHLEAVRAGAQWLRVHDVAAHVQALHTLDALGDTSVI